MNLITLVIASLVSTALLALGMAMPKRPADRWLPWKVLLQSPLGWMLGAYFFLFITISMPRIQSDLTWIPAIPLLFCVFKTIRHWRKH